MLVNISLSFIYNYLEETGCTPEHGRKLGEFHAARKFATMRMVGCGLDMNECWFNWDIYLSIVFLTIFI